MQCWIKTWWDALAVAVLAAGMLFPNLGSALFEPDESRYAEIPRLMLRSGDWLTPRLQGKPYNDKPPLVYWLIAGSYQVFGVSIEAARVVPVCFGWLTVLVLYAWVRRYLGRSTAFLSCFVLLSTIGFTALMRMLLLDGVLTFFVLSALLSGHHALATGRHRGWGLLSALLCGGGILTKGPVALVLVLPCLIALRWLDRSITPLRFRDVIGYSTIACLLALPWYAAMLLTNESFGAEFFLRHHLQRFLAPAHHERPFWFYLPTLLLELMPWSFVAPALCTRWRTWDGPLRLLAVFAAWCFVFFSLARCKLPTYLLPMLPAVAVLLATLLQTIWSSEDRRLRTALSLGLGVLLLALACRDVAIFYALDEGTPHINAPPLILAGLMLVLLVVSRGQRFCTAAMLMAWAVVWWTCHDAIPQFANTTSVVPACRQLALRAEAEGIPFVAHRNSWDAVSFMLNRDELDVFSSKELPAFVHWLQTHPRCMVWLREGDRRISRFVKSLPAGIELENIYDCGKLQAVILCHPEVCHGDTKRSAVSPCEGASACTCTRRFRPVK